MENIIVSDSNLCFACHKPISAGNLRRERPSGVYNGLIEINIRCYHSDCEKFNDRLKKAKMVLEKAEEEIASMEFALFLKRTHPVSRFS